ncbi:ubiquinol oxidase subunit II, cyanide insensitive [Aurantiacibacter atlanticus]|uniref:Ubiquinol oxidase subunit II, cyanide insensitive n=1 Tax=Aurantiacibacter atlanticus TaxID=1648404 RepID=A0A0H4W086_9SPHN|nr:cytochrome d ubiquinol oxidase subunit II [Aurantiacibacter atlanticus]AKQ42888.1 ubiquinol oxidase subunit II, cyanide insensitive [Aurantiacibacter atlanticus]MDF1835061.1 cytochrome d ubiquinol oxidase subunit II [Alteraurantiacibacter sp. bin_em_oilr2.035]
MAVNVDLTTIWAFIIAFGIFAYVVMDGFDLGIGILFPTFNPGSGRDRAMNSIAPVWDGNETWLVLGGGGLFAAFPLAYAVILPATYPLIIAMLLGLVFRGVAFEFRWRDPSHRKAWDFAFTGGSFVAAMAQGMTLGALLQGIEVVDRAYAGSWWDWLTPYTLLTGLGTVAGYALLGATWLVWKLDGDAQVHARTMGKRAAWATLLLIGSVSMYNLALNAEYASRWLSAPEIYFAAPVPILTGVVALALLRALATERHSKPFWLSIALFFLGMAGLGVTMWPYVVPPGITIWDAAAPERSQIFMLIGVAITMPLIIGYTAWAYWVFRGKVADEGYH